MTTPDGVSTQINEVLDVARRAFEADLSQGYENLNATIKQLEALARETFQQLLKPDHHAILNKLESGQSLTEAELNIVKLLIVGEAKYYVHHENDLDNWKGEVQRILLEMERLRVSGLNDVESLMHLRALCHDAAQVIPDLAFYYRQQERVKRFEQATAGPIDREAGRLLADFIRKIMASDQV